MKYLFFSKQNILTEIKSLIGVLPLAQKHQQLVKTFQHRKSLTKFAQKGAICVENEQYS